MRKLVVMFCAMAISTMVLGQKEKTVEVGGAAMYPSKNIIENAVNSKDHTTLVTAVKAADLVSTLQSDGPFTVFAPSNAAFDKLPAGTVEGLLKPEKKTDLVNILEYHTYVGSLKAEYFNDGQSFEQVNGKKVNIINISLFRLY